MIFINKQFTLFVVMALIAATATTTEAFTELFTKKEEKSTTGKTIDAGKEQFVKTKDALGETANNVGTKVIDETGRQMDNLGESAENTRNSLTEAMQNGKAKLHDAMHDAKHTFINAMQVFQKTLTSGLIPR